MFRKLKQIQMPLLMGWPLHSGPAHGARPGMIKNDNAPLPHARSLAALALHDLVTLLDQALALAILAFLLLLDVGALLIGHVIAPRQSNA
jgi:hypothetical protein